jgi:hypothetical protein
MPGKKAPLIKASLAALALSALLAGAFFMPLTISQRALQPIPFVARYYCPESGTFAEQYFRSRSARSSPDDYVICLGRNGERLSDKAVHGRVVRHVWLAWTILIFPLFFLSFRALFGPSAKWTVRRRQGLRRQGGETAAD